MTQRPAHPPEGVRHPLRQQAAALLKRHLPEGVRHIVVALSGGADSVALLHVLRSLQGQFEFTLSAAHLNHNLRGEEALRDQHFVEALCASWGVPLTVESLPVAAAARERGLSIETAGRETRYALFARLCTEIERAGGGPCVTATAHTLSDQAETVLLRLMRGAGVDGLAGIPPARPGLIRPLLDSSRADIEDYCAVNNLSYVTDSTNLHPMYARNHVRLELMPLLQRHNPAILETLGRQADLMREEAELLAQLADSLPLLLAETSEAVTLDRDLLKAQPTALARRALRRHTERKFGLALSQRQSDQLTALCYREGNGVLRALPGGLVAKADYSRLTLRIGEDNPRPEPPERQLEVGPNELPGFGILTIATGPVQELQKQMQNNFHPVYTHLLKYDIINGMPIVRGRRERDAYTPAGRPRKTLKRMAIDARIPASQRAVLPVVTTPEGEILSAWPFGPACPYALRPDETCGDVPALLLHYEPESESALEAPPVRQIPRIRQTAKQVPGNQHEFPEVTEDAT